MRRIVSRLNLSDNADLGEYRHYGVSPSWEGLVAPFSNKASCLTGQATVLTVQVGTLHREMWTYMVALKANSEKEVQLRAWM